MTFITGLVIGLFVGGIIGVAVIAIVSAGRDDK